jgi:PilZ domain
MPSSDPPVSQVSYRDKRTVPRYPLIATVEILECVSEMRLCGRLSEISRKGCYVDVLNALPVGTMIQLRVSRDKGTFVTAGKIIYVHEGMGMGVAFTDPAADQLQILDSWLSELA